MAVVQPRGDLFPSSWSVLLSELMEQSWGKYLYGVPCLCGLVLRDERDLEVGLMLIYKIVLLILSVLIHLTNCLKGSMNQCLCNSLNMDQK